MCVWCGEELTGRGGSAKCFSEDRGAGGGGTGMDGVKTAAPGLNEKACVCVCGGWGGGGGGGGRGSE